jgi:hypothetical protein
MALALSCVSHALCAAPVEVPSCYVGADVSLKAPPIKRELFIVIDQTTKFDVSLQETANQKIQKFLRAGDRVVLVSFSANAKDRYSEVVLDGRLDEDIPDNQKFTTGKLVIAKIAKCLREQEAAVRQLMAGYLQRVFAAATTNLPNTELLGTLSALSKDMIGTHAETKKYVLVISDMMEHSALTSFYANNKARKIDPTAELAKVKSAGMVGTLSQVSFYVHGAGFSEDGRYRSALEMNAIEEFWRQWIALSGGALRGYGTPSLFNEIGQ